MRVSGERGPGAATRTRAVTIDALGTLIELEPPWEHLPAKLGEEVERERVERAFRAEMAYYRDHAHEGRDAASLADLRSRCARVLSEELGREVPVETLMAAIRFRAYPDAEPALRELRELGIRIVCVSNWDISLPEVLERVALRRLLDGVVSSASAGARKPDPAIFEPALELAGCGPEEALHVGDTAEEDFAAARAAGIRAVLLVRDDRRAGELDGAPVIGSLNEIRNHLVT